MQRSIALTIVVSLLISSFSFGGVVTPPGMSEEAAKSAEFLEAKKRLQRRKVAVSHDCPAHMRAALKAFARAIRKRDLDAVIQFLKRNDKTILGFALSHIYYFSSGTKILDFKSALQLAVAYANTDPSGVAVARGLVDFAAANPDLMPIVLDRNENGQTALHMAIYLNEVGMVEMFLEAVRKYPWLGDRIFVNNGRGETPFEAALRYGRPEIVELFRQNDVNAVPTMPAPDVDGPNKQPTEVQQLFAPHYIAPAIVFIALLYFTFGNSKAEK